MARYVELEIDGVVTLVEVTVTPTVVGSEQTSAVGEAMAEAMRQGLENVETVIKGLTTRMGRLFISLGETVTPEEVNVEFAVTMNAQGNVIVAKIGQEATFKVSVTYKPHERRPSPTPASD